MKAIDWAEQRAANSIKAVIDEYEDPDTFRKVSSDEKVQPDISYVSNIGAVHYIEIALKIDQPRELVSKWKLLSTMASMKRGKLHLLAPKGHKQFAQQLVNKYNINAIVHAF